VYEMDARIRRIVMLCTILTFGLILIFFDFTLIQLIAMMILIVIIMPFLLGLTTVGEVRTALAGMRKTGILKRLDNIKFFEKSSSPGLKPAPKPVNPVQKSEAKETKAKDSKSKTTDKSSGIRAHFTAFMSSLGSLGTIIQQRAKGEKKVEDINKMLDKAVSEKVTKAAPPAGTGGMAISSPAGGAGPATGGSSTETDPFLALSNDDFDPGLLDGLDDEPASFPSPDGDGKAGGSGLLPEPELSMPSLEEDMAASAPALPGDAGTTSDDGGLDAFKGLDAGDALDEDFGDLDSLSLDDMELDDDMGGGTSAEPVSAPDTPAPSGPSPAAPPADSGAVKTAWVPSDAPKGGEEDQIAVQSDMASFASSSGGSDEDLLSSIASDVKTVKKEADVSLLRELKDFKAPADEIETELKDMFDRMGIVQKTKEKTEPSANGMK
jgi:hypothetical protein